MGVEYWTKKINVVISASWCLSFLVVAQAHYLQMVHIEKLKQLMGEYDQISPPSPWPDKENPFLST
jgi:hypothetical protein